MTNWRTRVRPLILACVAGLAMSGCGVNGAPDDGTDPEQAPDSEAEEQSPLSEFLGEGAGFATGGRVVMSMSSADLSDEERQQMRQVEELVAECMQELGFEYVPTDPSAGDDGEDPFAEAYSLPPDEFAREYGYGMTTLMLPKRPTDEVADPNQEIREGLSEAALEEYNRALFGAMAEVSDGGGAVAIKPTPGETVSPEDQGCHMRATSEVYGDSGPMGGPDMGEFDGLFQDLDALRERIDSDPRLVRATEAWAGCMAQAGYSEFESTQEPEDTVMTQMSELYGWDRQDDEGGVSVSVGGPGGLDDVDIDEAALGELQEYEIAVATADYDCEQEHLADVQHDVAWGFEEEFVEENRAELERFRDAMAEGPVGGFGVRG